MPYLPTVDACHGGNVSPMIGTQVANQGMTHGAGNLRAIRELLVVLGLKNH